jgi:indole-3-glycerol phosphate synthase
MSEFLNEMLEGSRVRLEISEKIESFEELMARAKNRPDAPALKLGSFDLIAEIKFASPSGGKLVEPPKSEVEVAKRANAYEQAGAACISVLTEPWTFLGKPSYLRFAAGITRIPVMRKDFIIHPYQVWEARCWGAGGVLLIVRMVDDDMLQQLLVACAETGMFALVECFDAEDVGRAATALQGTDARALVGVNTRDLQTLEVREDRLEKLISILPDDVPAVAESGMNTPEDVRRAALLGYRLALVGSALMRADNPGQLISEMVAAGREAVG